MCTVALVLILILDVLPAPHAHATGSARSNLAVGAKTAGDSDWSALGTGVNGEVFAIAVSGNDVYAGGDFQDNDNGAPNHIAKWNSGSGWLALGQGTDGSVYAIAMSGTDVYVGGSFNHAGGKDAHGIAKYSAASVKVYLPLVLRAS